MNSYTMDSRVEIADRGTGEIVSVLEKMPHTIAVINVEKDKYFQKKDIDILWIYKNNGKEHMKRIEIKVDTYSESGNYFIETVSNMDKNTKGCFLYTEAEFLFYYFIHSKELNIIPMTFAREWFLKNEQRFRESELKTAVGRNGYRSKGRLVPKKVLNKEVSGVKTIIFKELLNIAG